MFDAERKKSKNGKQSTERLSVHFCCRAAGEDLKPLVTSNVAPVQAIREQWIDIMHLPVD
jgi:hypothetical protein